MMSSPSSACRSLVAAETWDEVSLLAVAGDISDKRWGEGSLKVAVAIEWSLADYAPDMSGCGCLINTEMESEVFGWRQ